MTKLLKNLSLVAAIVFGLSLSLAARAQNTSAQLTGKITDSTGAVVPHARVTAKNTDTNLTKTSESMMWEPTLSSRFLRVITR